MLRSLFLFALSIGLGLAPASARALPRSSEVFYDATGSDNGKSFVELYGAQGTSLDGLVLEGVNGSNGAVGPILTLSGVIPEDGFFVVADDRGDGLLVDAGQDQRRLALKLGQLLLQVPKAREQLGPWETVAIGAPGALFDTQADRGETQNLAGAEPQKLAELEALLQRIRQSPDR